MCGIVGIVNLDNWDQINPDVLHAMNERQHHRGPDEGDVHLEPGVGLGHRRLSIIDLSSGQQPLFNEDGSVVVVYNGEIYNFRELAEELKRAGHQFRTHCDTEVIVHAWEEWGQACVKRFRGMFAFALWDRNQRTLFLARDRLGIKPLYYAVLPNNKLIFASELKALYVCEDLPREIDPFAVEDYFAYGYIPDPKTILRHAKKLPPGHTLTIEHGKEVAATAQYWDVPFELTNGADDADTRVELIDRLREAVDVRLISEVPLGAFLSGGVDSSAVVAMMAGLSDSAVKTCSISFGESEYDEVRFAAIVAEKYHTDHSVERVDPDAYELVETLADLYDEPYADSSALPTYNLCKLARQRVTVALSGDGGDETMAGYRRYRWHKYEEKMRGFLPDGIRQPMFRFLGRAYPKADWAPRVFRAKSTFESLARDSIAGYLHSISPMHTGFRDTLFSETFRRSLQGYRADQVLREHAKRAPVDDPVSLVQYLDIKTYLPGDILTKVDRASMAHSLEVRVPILDHPLVEWISGLRPSLKMNGTEGKYVFKRALEPYLPNTILYREKMGFGVPLASWFRGPLRERVQHAVLGSTLQDTGIFDHAVLETLVQQHMSGKRDHSSALWSLLMYEAFHRRVMV